MPASITGSDITLTGVEASPAVLSTIAGVVTSTQGAYTVYDLGDRRLIIAGTLTHDPELHLIRTGANSPQNTIDIVAGGVYNYGVETTVNGALRRSKAMGLMITSTNLVACCSDGGFTVRSGGTFNMRGGQILINSCIAWPSGSNVLIRDGRLINLRGAMIRLRQSNTPDINGLVLDGGISLDQFAVPIQLKAFQPEFGERALELISGAAGGTSAEVIFEGYKAQGLVVDGSNWAAATMLFLNCLKGSGISVRSNNQGGGSSAVTRIMQDLSVTASQLGTGIAIAGAQLYAKDVNNGLRASRTAASGTVYNFVANQIYQGTSNAAGLVPNQRILTAVVYSNVQGSSDNLDIIKDYRTKTTDGQDILDVHVFGYLHTAQTLSSIALKADGIAVKAAASLGLDTSISEPVSATVNSYASIDTLDKLYDRAKLWKLQNLALEVPTVLGLPITANGAVLDLGAFSLVVDSAAVANFSITGSVITIKAATLSAGTKFTSFKTTGTVTTVSAAVNVPFTDSAGNSYLQFESVDTWQVYSSAARTTLLGAGTGAQLFKFNFAVNTSYFLNLVASGEEFRKTAVPAAAGATLVSLSSTALLTALNAKVLDVSTTRTAVWGAVTANYLEDGTSGQKLNSLSAGLTAAGVWTYVDRQITADPGAARHTATQSAIAAIPAAPTAAQNATAAWAASTRTLTADPGASAHTVTQTAIAAIPAAPTSSQVATAVHQRAIEGALTLEGAMRVMLAPLSGKATGIGTGTETYLSQDGASARLVATIDAQGNRTAVAVTP